MLIANLCTLLAKGCADETTARMADWRQPRRLPEVHRASPTNLSLTVRKLRRLSANQLIFGGCALWSLLLISCETASRIEVPPGAGTPGATYVRFMTWAEETGGGFSLLEHPIPPHTLAAPLHRHSREDEYSFVL